MSDPRLQILATCFALVFLSSYRHMVLAARAGSVWDLLLVALSMGAAIIPIATLAFRFMGVTQ